MYKIAAAAGTAVAAVPLIIILLMAANLPTLLLPKTSSMLVGADAWVRPMLCAMAAGGALVLQGNAVAW